MGKQEQKQSVAVITDNALVGIGLKHVVGDFCTIKIMPRKILQYKAFPKGIDLILVLLEMDVWEEAMQFIYLQAQLDAKIMVCDVQHHSVRESMALQLGACDYLLQNTPPNLLLERIKQCLKGQAPGAIRLAQLLLQHNIPRLPRMTETQVQILEMLHLNPLTPSKQIAQHIFRSSGRVKNVLTDIYQRFGVPDRYHLAARLQGLHYFQGCMPMLQLVEGLPQTEPVALPRRHTRLTPCLDYTPPLLVAANAS